jgi:hypothetical protein
MKVVVEIPEGAQAALPPTGTLSRDLLESYVVEHYRKGSLTQKQVGLLLGLDRWSTEEFLQKREAIQPLNLADYQIERSSRRIAG